MMIITGLQLSNNAFSLIPGWGVEGRVTALILSSKLHRHLGSFEIWWLGHNWDMLACS